MTAPHIAPDWTDGALCAQVGPGGDLWFPEQGGDQGTRAKWVCRKCPVIAQCAQAAIDARERFGIWAGVAVNGDCTAPTKLRRLAAGTAPEDVFTTTTRRGAA